LEKPAWWAAPMAPGARRHFMADESLSVEVVPALCHEPASALPPVVTPEGAPNNDDSPVPGVEVLAVKHSPAAMKVPLMNVSHAILLPLQSAMAESTITVDSCFSSAIILSHHYSSSCLGRWGGIGG